MIIPDKWFKDRTVKYYVFSSVFIWIVEVAFVCYFESWRLLLALPFFLVAEIVLHGFFLYTNAKTVAVAHGMSIALHIIVLILVFGIMSSNHIMILLPVSILVIKTFTGEKVFLDGLSFEKVDSVGGETLPTPVVVIVSVIGLILVACQFIVWLVTFQWLRKK